MGLKTEPSQGLCVTKNRIVFIRKADSSSVGIDRAKSVERIYSNEIKERVQREWTEQNLWKEYTLMRSKGTIAIKLNAIIVSSICSD